MAFAYINGKIKFSNHGKTPSEKQKRTVFRWLAFLLGSFMGCFLFPTYNFTKTYPNGSHWYSVYLWPTFAFAGESGYTLGFRRRIAHSGLHAETGGVSDGVVSLLSERSARSRTSPGRVSERRILPLLGLGRGHSRRTQRAFGTAMRLCASLFRGVAAPPGCATLLVYRGIYICERSCRVLPIFQSNYQRCR